MRSELASIAESKKPKTKARVDRLEARFDALETRPNLHADVRIGSLEGQVRALWEIVDIALAQKSIEWTPQERKKIRSLYNWANGIPQEPKELL